MAHNQSATAACPFAKQPFAECAIRDITGANIPRISRFCLGDYTLCPVYKSRHEIRIFRDAPDATDQATARLQTPSL